MSTTEQRSTGDRLHQGHPVPPAGSWAVDADHTSVEFVARHLLSKVRGRFTSFDGRIEVGENPLESSVEVTVDAASVQTNSEQRDGHLLSADFFDVERYPTLRFASRGVEAIDGATWRLHGDLTIRDRTRPVTLEFEYLGLIKDPWGNDKIHFTAHTQVNREEWGLTWNAALETGGVMVGRDVRLEFELQAGRA